MILAFSCSVLIVVAVAATLPPSNHRAFDAARELAAATGSFCRPVFGLTESQCKARIDVCNKRGVNFPPSMKWVRLGCKNGTRSAGDGGCQCAQYCGYTCMQACRVDTMCTWDRGVCKQKSTGLPTGPVTNCHSCIMRRCGANAPQSPCKAACDSNTQCRNGVCIAKDGRRCDSSFQCASGSCVHSKCLTTQTMNPTSQPTTYGPSVQPSYLPTNDPTALPTNEPSVFPSLQPSWFPTTQAPSLSPTPCTYVQLRSKLLGSDSFGAADQGWSVSISGDGNTAIVGGYNDNSGQGAAWVYVRNASNLWEQQGPKLVGTGNIGPANQGWSVSVSGDGNTAISGGYYDNTLHGAAWIFVRSGSSWSQQGEKLLGAGNAGTAYQGHAVSISTDGNTAIVGGYGDNSQQGAVWIFVRNASNSWQQQGPKLVGTGNQNEARQGSSVSISSDGNTVIFGAPSDNSYQGAAWIFVRNASNVWEQHGAKLVGTDSTGPAYQGYSVSISGDGNTVILGGRNDASTQGAAWVFIRNASNAWEQQGPKLVGSGNTGFAMQGFSVSVSSNGNTALIGGLSDDVNRGAMWIFVRSGSTWFQQGPKFALSQNESVDQARLGVSVSVSGDGTTAVVGGYGESSFLGAAWVLFLRGSSC